MNWRKTAAATLALALAAAAALLPLPAAAQCEAWIRGPMDDGTLPNGSDGYIYDSINWDPDGAGPLQERLVVAGNFNAIGGVAANNVAQYDPSTAQWLPFGNGIARTVYCLVVFNGQVVAGCDGDNNEGTFDETVQRWTGSAWEYLSATNTGNVRDMIVYNGSLYIAGTFITQFVIPGSDPAHYLARWVPGSVKWEDVNQADFGSQTNTAVRALAEYNGDLYAAGWKASTGSGTGSAIHITHGNGAGLWTTITDGTDPGGIYDLDVFGGELLIAGGFLEINGVTCNGFAGWNGSSFHAFQGGVSNPSGGHTVWSIVIHEGICIGGDFTSAGGTTVNRVAFWPPGGSAWQARGTGIDDTVYDLTSYRGELIAVGSFANAGVPANDIAHWNGTSWAAFGGGTANYVLAYASYNGRLVAGGSFAQPTQSLGAANNIAGWSGGSLSAFGTGMNNVVYALESFKYPGINGSYELIAGGIFTTAGGVGALRIARWRESPFGGFPPPAWEPMGAGFNFNVYAIERMGGVTYAGGNFTSSGATAVSRIARWNETTDVWENLTGLGGMNGTVYALKEFNGSLYAGGSFTTAGGSSTGGLARWTGTSWVQVGGFFQGTVYALEVFNGSLIIGGQFPGLAGGANIALWDGANYHNLGSGGTNSVGVRALKTNGLRLYAAGAFTAVGGVSANNVAWWDGAAWHDANGGANNVVWALGTMYNEVHVGGEFSSVQGGTTATPRWARYTETGVPWISLNPTPFSQTVSPGATVVFSAAAGGGFPGLAYQWTHNEVPLVNGTGPYGSTISGAQTQVLTIADVAFADQGAYRLVVTNGCGSVTSGVGTLSFPATSDVESQARVSIFHSIGPNPSGGESTLSFSLADAAEVRYSVFDLRGRRVRQVDLGRLPAGRFEARWDTRDDSGRQVAAGVYFVSLDLGDRRLGARRLTIVR
ncbi:MAG: hypothetical protein IPK64_02455 [bacterium]|nr:hypothetical protein [bacterium]